MYQIKSKTFATRKMIGFCDRKENEQTMNISMEYLRDKQRNKEQEKGDKAYVRAKMGVEQIREDYRDEARQQRVRAGRTIWMCLSRVSRRIAKLGKNTAWEEMAFAKMGIIKNR